MTYLLDENGDLDLSFKRTEGIRARAGKIIQTSKGEIRSNPVLGVDIVKYQRSKISQEALQKKILLNLRLDNISEQQVKNNLTIK